MLELSAGTDDKGASGTDRALLRFAHVEQICGRSAMKAFGLLIVSAVWVSMLVLTS
jgi:hypothetical protein